MTRILLILSVMLFVSVSHSKETFTDVSNYVANIILKPKLNPKKTMKGTAFLISDDGYMLTNYHVVSKYDKSKGDLLIMLFKDKTIYLATLIGTDEASDIALLKINVNNSKYLKFSDKKVKLGDDVYALGYPANLGLILTKGIVSATHSLKVQPYIPYIQSDVVINGGNSGGPLLNTDLEVVGINTILITKDGGYMGYSLALPIDLVKYISAQLRNGKARHGLFGISVIDNPPRIYETYARHVNGAYVNKVYPNLPASDIGLTVGDNILAINNTLIKSSQDIPVVLFRTPPNKEIDIIYMHNAKMEMKKVKLREYVKVKRSEMSQESLKKNIKTEYGKIHDTKIINH